jgi:hypothetical protein
MIKPVGALLILLATLLSPAAAQDLATRNVVLVTVDGLRPLEVFSGLDPSLLADKKKSGIEDVEKLRSLYWRAEAKERREALLPFFWARSAPVESATCTVESPKADQSFNATPVSSTRPPAGRSRNARVVVYG